MTPFTSLKLAAFSPEDKTTWVLRGNDKFVLSRLQGVDENNGVNISTLDEPGESTPC